MKYFLSGFIVYSFIFCSFAEENKATYLLKHYREAIKSFSASAHHIFKKSPDRESLAQSIVLIETTFVFTETNKEVTHNIQDPSNKEVTHNTQDPSNKEVTHNTQDPSNKKRQIINRFTFKGTGFFIRPNIIVTNLHNLIQEDKLASPEQLRFRHNEGEWQPIKKIKFLSFSKDLALLETESPGIPLELADPNDKIQNDSLVYTLGFLNKKIVKRQWNLLKVIDEEILLSALFIQPKLNGLSGSPLLNKQGKVIGVFSNGGSLSWRDGREREDRTVFISSTTGWAIKASDLRMLLKQTSFSDLSFDDIKNQLQSEISALHEKTNWVWDRETQAQAQYRLGWAYKHGIGTTKNLKKTIKLWNNSAQNEYLSTLMHLGAFYHRKGSMRLKKLLNKGTFTGEQFQFVQKNYLKAYHLWRTAALKGHPEAQFQVGYMFYKNEVIEGPRHLRTKKNNRSAYWIKLAAEQGHPLAQILLGYWHLHGFDVPKDVIKTQTLWEKVAKKGHPEAQYLLAVLYKNQAKLLKNTKKKKALEKAFYWHNKHKSQILEDPVVPKLKDVSVKFTKPVTPTLPNQEPTQNTTSQKCQNIFKK